MLKSRERPRRKEIGGVGDGGKGKGGKGKGYLAGGMGRDGRMNMGGWEGKGLHCPAQGPGYLLSLLS